LDPEIELVTDPDPDPVPDPELDIIGEKLFVELGLNEFKYIPYGGSNDLVIELVIEFIFEIDW